MNFKSLAVVTRLRFIDCLLEHYGCINRAQVEDYFGISSPQASLDFALYLERAPDNMAYDTSTRMYRRLETFKRRWP